MIRRLPSQFAVACLFCIAIGLAGCEKQDQSLAVVTGSVLFNGVAAPAQITFTPVHSKDQQGGRVSSASTDDDGQFRLNYSAEKEGAIVGDHRVEITLFPANLNGQPTSLSEASRSAKSVKLLRTVKAGANHFCFAVTY